MNSIDDLDLKWCGPVQTVALPVQLPRSLLSGLVTAALLETMFLHDGLLRVSLNPVYHLPWHKHCFVVACHLLKAALALSIHVIH